MWFIALTVATWESAAALDPPKQQGSGHAKLYFLREDGSYGFGAAPRVKIDGQLIGSLSNGSYVVVERPAGKHTLRLRTAAGASRTLEVELEPGELLIQRWDSSEVR